MLTHFIFCAFLEDLVEYFSQYGAITDVNVKYNSATGNPRGFGFVTFASASSIDAVFESGPHSIKNKQIDPRRAKNKSKSKKIFVGGLDYNLSEDEIRSHFCKFGSIESVELPYDKFKGRRREFAFITFDSEQAADAAFCEPKQVIGGRECEIKRALTGNKPHSRFQKNYHNAMPQEFYGNNQGWPRGAGYDNARYPAMNRRNDRVFQPRNGYLNNAGFRMRWPVFHRSPPNPEVYNWAH